MSSGSRSAQGVYGAVGLTCRGGSIGALLVAAAMMLGCGASSRSPNTRSPSLDYVDPHRSASDGKVLGANEQAPGDTLKSTATNRHLGKGWAVEEGGLHYSEEGHEHHHHNTQACDADAGPCPESEDPEH